MKRAAAGALDGQRRLNAPGTYTFDGAIWNRSKTQTLQVMELVLPKLKEVRKAEKHNHPTIMFLGTINEYMESEREWSDWIRNYNMIDEAFREVDSSVSMRRIDEVASKHKYFKDD